jgi:hypothetical protein
MPAAYPLTRWIESLPPMFMREYADHTVWQWVGLALSVVAIFAVIRLVAGAIRIFSRRLSEPVQEWVKLLVPITVALVLIGIHQFINHGLNITGQVLSVVTQIFDTVVYLINVEIFAYVNTADWNEFLAIQEDLNLRIMRIIEEAGTDFATPARLYHARDRGLDSERRQVAEKRVGEWAAAQTLPFPEFTHEYRTQITNTLDYPPDGSPAAN